MKTKWFIGSLLMVTLTLLLFTHAHAIRPIEDFRAPVMVQEMVIEKLTADVDAVAEQNGSKNEVQEHVDEIRDLLNLDTLDRNNTMMEALRQENLDDRIRGNEDLELAMAEKSVDLHLGKVLTDMNGNRVRMEEYILRPADNRIQFLNLTMRNNRLDYIDYNAHFNTTLPYNTTGLWRKSFGQEKPTIYLTKETVSYSNLDDFINYDVLFFEPTWVTELQQYYLPEKQKTLHINETFKYGETRVSAQEDMQYMEGAVGIKSFHAEFIDSNVLAVREVYTFNDDTHLTMERFLIDEDGAIRSLRWNSLEDWVYWTQHFDELIFNSYNEIVWTASEFEGRNIDIVSQFLHLVNVFNGDNRVWH